MNQIWPCIMLLSVIFGAINGKMQAVSDAVFSGGQQAVELSLTLLGTICLWSGLMSIAEKAGLTRALSRLMSPVLRLLFPGLDPAGPAARAISMNVAANILGLGNAATPLGLNAMRQLQEENPQKDTASNHMILFVVMNTASIQLIPTTIAALRARYGSHSPMDVMPAIWISSVLSLCVGIVAAAAFMGRRNTRRGTLSR